MFFYTTSIIKLKITYNNYGWLFPYLLLVKTTMVIYIYHNYFCYIITMVGYTVTMVGYTVTIVGYILTMVYYTVTLY